MRRLAVLLAALILVPGLARAATWDHGCDGSSSFFGAQDSRVIDGNERACWDFNNGDGATTSPAFEVLVDRALLCFDPDTGSAGKPTSGGLVTPYYCPAGSKPSSNPQNACFGLGQLDGTEGDSSTQKVCVSVGQGVYYFAVDVACGTSHSCRATVQGQPTVSR